MSKLNIDMIREIKNNHPAVPEPFLNESKLLDVEEDCRKAFLSSRTGRLGAFGKAFHSFIEAPSGDLVSAYILAIDSKDERNGYSNEIDEADLHDFLAAVLFGPGIRIAGNRPIIGRLVELINRPVCVVRTLETDEGETVPVCSNCGEPISLTDSFCPHCSAEVVGNELDC